ncbi:MAG: hypothetical protein ABEJ08_04180 [Halobacteriaceae archaeon]
MVLTASGVAAAVWPVSDLLELARYFGDVALADPVSTVLLVVGFVLVGGAAAVGGLLTLGAVVDAVTPALD